MKTSGLRVGLGVASGWLAGAASVIDDMTLAFFAVSLSVAFGFWFFDLLIIDAVNAINTRHEVKR